MSNVIFGLVLVIMVLVSLRAIRKPGAVPYIDEMIAKDAPRRSWNVLSLLIGLVAIIFLFRLLFAA